MRRLPLVLSLLLAVVATVVITTAPNAAGAPTGPAATVKSIVFPVKYGASWTDTFGACRGAGCSRSHQGQDLFAPKGRPLVATVHGTVDRVGFGLSLSGNYVSIRGNDGWRYLYIHLNNDRPGTDDGRGTRLQAVAPGIHEGAKVRAGQVIGYLGDSGNAEYTPPHVHFEIRTPDNVSINPADSLRRASRSWLDEADWRSRYGSFGSFPLIQSAPGGARLAGWAVDRSTSAAVPIEVHAGGRLHHVFRADQPRSDLAVFGKGIYHAFDRVVGLPAGTHNVCLVAGDPDGGPATGLGCRSVKVLSGSPRGALDSAALVGPHLVGVRGWSLDPDVANAVEVHVYAFGSDGSVHGAVNLGVTAVERADVDRAYPGWRHQPRGYEGVVRAGSNVRVCAYGINYRLGGTSRPGCRAVSVPSGYPRGRLDEPVALGGGRFQISGWTVDPDVASPIDAHVHFIPSDGTPRRISSAGTAQLPRGDVEVTFPGWGPDHGFATEIVVDRDGYVCAFGLNAAGTPGSNASFPCRLLDV